MKKYRITKYNPTLRDKYGRYTQCDWTSCSDIGKEYVGKLFEVEDYLSIEQKYFQSILFILQEMDINCLEVTKLEKRRTLNQIEEFVHGKSLSISERGKDIFTSICDNDLIFIEDIFILMQLVLRECLWCRLVSPSTNFVVEFGYDYYMYVLCDDLQKELISKIQDLGMFVEIIDLDKFE